MEQITFISAERGNTMLNGVSIDFKMRYSRTRKDFKKNEVRDILLKITLTRYVLIQWKVSENLETENLIKLTFPFAIKLISEKVKDRTLKEFEEKVITTEDKIVSYPFDINKIKKIEGYKIDFSDSESDNDIGSRIEINILADSIIELRDNINAIIYAKEKDILLKLGQERNILYLFRKIENREQFFFAIATLGNLVTDINSKLLKKILNNHEKNLKSITLLEHFLTNIENKKYQAVEIFKTINRIRQGFPIHTDKADLLKNLKKFNIDYPLNDYNKTWQLLLEKYKLGLIELLETVNKYKPNTNL